MELALGAALSSELVAEALELLVVVDGQVEHAASLVDALRDRFGVADRELLPRVGEPQLRVFWQNRDKSH